MVHNASGFWLHPAGCPLHQASRAAARMNLMRAATPWGMHAVIPADITGYLSLTTVSDVGRLFFRPVNFSMNYSVRPHRSCQGIPDHDKAMSCPCHDRSSSFLMWADSMELMMFGQHAVVSKAVPGKALSRSAYGLRRDCACLCRGCGRWQAAATACWHDDTQHTCNHVFI